MTIYAENSLIRAEAGSEGSLVILKYLYIMYYCAPVSEPGNKQLVYNLSVN